MKRIKHWLDHYSGRFFAALLAVTLLCYGCMYLIESNFGSVAYDKENCTLEELAALIQENNEKNGKNIEISFTASDSTNIQFMTMKPKNASAEHPVPLIIACHGSNNAMQSYLMACSEMTRRGYGVLLFDGAGHGETTVSVSQYTHNTAGFEAVLEYGMSLSWVDENNVGITGHSWGSRQVNAVTNYVNNNTSNHIKAALYCGSGQGLGMDPQESQIYLGALAAVYDEHLNNMEGNGSYDLSSQRNARIQIDHLWPEFSADEVDPEWLAGRGGRAPLQFGDDASVEIGVWYTDEGTVPFDPTEELSVKPGSLIFFNPTTSHEGTVYNKEGISYFIQYWQAVFGTPEGVEYIPANQQVSQLSKWFSFVAFWTLFLMLFPLVNLLLKTDFFNKLKKEPAAEGIVPSFRSASGQLQFWITSIVTVTFALVSFFLICGGDSAGSSRYFPGNERWPVNDANKYLIWMMAQGLFNILFYSLINGIQEWRDKKAGRAPAGVLTVLLKGSTLMDVFRSLLFANILVFAFWGTVRIGWDVFHTMIRFSLFPGWMIPVQVWPYPFARIWIIVRYMPLFMIAWVPMTLGLSGSRYKDVPEWVISLLSGLLNALPLIIFIVYEYVGFLGPKHNVTNYDLYWLGGMLKTFVLPMFILPILTRFMYRKTKNVWVATSFNVIFITLYTLCTLIMYWDAVIM